jgi:hypothetical protein
MTTDKDIAEFVIRSLDGRADFDVAAITDEIHDTFGLVDPETIDHDTYWAIIARHDTGG